MLPLEDWQSLLQVSFLKVDALSSFFPKSSSMSFSLSSFPLVDLNGKTTLHNQQLQPPQPAGSHLSVSPKKISTDKGLELPWSAGTTFDSRHSKEDLQANGSVSPPSFDAPVHRHSPSLPADLSQFSATSPQLVTNNSNTSTPRSNRKSSHRPTTSDSHSSLDVIHNKQGGVGNEYLSPTFSSTTQMTSPSLHKTNSMNDDLKGGHHQAPSLFPSTLKYDPYLDSKIASSGNRFANSSSNLSTSSGGGAGMRDDGVISGSSNRGAGKRKGTVKSFLNGIKNNVVG